MSNRRGRCFRQQRRTARRKARQSAALRALDGPMPREARINFGRLTDFRWDLMRDGTKQKIVEAFKRRPQMRRRAGRGG